MKMIPRQLVNQLFNTNNQILARIRHTTMLMKKKVNLQPLYTYLRMYVQQNKVLFQIRSEYINEGYFKFNQYNQLINTAQNSIKPIVPSFKAHKGEGTDIENRILQHKSTNNRSHCCTFIFYQKQRFESKNYLSISLQCTYFPIQLSKLQKKRNI